MIEPEWKGSPYLAELIGGPADGERFYLTPEEYTFGWNIALPILPGPHGAARCACYLATDNCDKAFLREYIFIGNQKGRGKAAWYERRVESVAG